MTTKVVTAPFASFFFGVRIKVRNNFGSIFNYILRGLGLKIRVWVMIRASVRVGVSVVLWSW